MLLDVMLDYSEGKWENLKNQALKHPREPIKQSTFSCYRKFRCFWRGGPFPWIFSEVLQDGLCPLKIGRTPKGNEKVFRASL